MNLFRRAVESFLPDRDYLPVAMPTSDLHVLFVLTAERGVLRRYSTLGSVLVAGDGIPEPEIVHDAVVADASGSMTRSTKLGLGLSVVSSIVRALGGGAGLRLSASNAHTVQYGYSDVFADRVDFVTLDRWLTAADFDPTTRATAELLTAEACHVVVAVLKARALDVTVLDEHDQAVELDVPELQAMVGADVKVQSSSSRAGTLTFHGQTALAIAAKVARIKLDEHGFVLGNRPTEGEIRGGGLSGAGRHPVTYLEAPELRFAEP